MNVTVENLTESLATLKEKLHNGAVNFTYRKKDGSIRTAKGTLNLEVMGDENAPKGTGSNGTDTTTRYFDLNSMGWRSFVNVDLVSIDE